MRLVIAGISSLIAAIGVYVFLTLPAQEQYGVPFALVDHNGDTITQEAFTGQPSAIFFGFTHCPEICPTTLFEMDGWLAQLGDEGKDIDVFFVTIDPERDTPELLGDYITSVTDRVRGITGDPDAVREMARGFNIYFKRIEEEGGSYTMDHTASIILLDSKGQFRKTIAYGEVAETAMQKLRDISKT